MSALELAAGERHDRLRRYYLHDRYDPFAFMEQAMFNLTARRFESLKPGDVKDFSTINS